jgi:hypothetical protein
MGHGRHRPEITVPSRHRWREKFFALPGGRGRSERWKLNPFISETVRKVSYWITRHSEHETDEAHESHGHGGKVLKILGEAAASIEPSEGSLDNPPAEQDLESFGGI